MGVGQMKVSSIKVSSIQGILFNDTCVSARNPNYRALISVETKAASSGKMGGFPFPR